MADPNRPMSEQVVEDESKALLDRLTTDFKRLQQQKSRIHGSVEARILRNLCFLNDEQYITFTQNTMGLELRDPKDKNKLYLMFNLIGPRVNKLLGRMSAMAPPFKAQPDKNSPEAFAIAEVVDQLVKALDQKLDQPSRNWEILYWLLIAGVAFEHVPWIPNATMDVAPKTDPVSGEQLYTYLPKPEIEVRESEMQMAVQQGEDPANFRVLEEAVPMGEVGSEILSPLNVFIDNSVRSVADLAPDQRVYIAKVRTMGWIEENFGETLEPDTSFSIVSTHFSPVTENAIGGVFLKDLIPLVQGSNDDADMPMAVIVESYAPASLQNPRGRYTVFCPGKRILYDAENPYEEIPIIDYHWKPVTQTFWTQDYISALVPPQKFINKRLSQLGEQSNATLYSQLLLGPGISKDQIPADFPGVVEHGLAENGAPLVARLQAPELPAWFMNSIEMVLKTFNDIAGGADLFQEQKFPGQLRGPMAVPMLQEILDTEWGPFYRHFAERLGRAKQMRMNRVKQFYPESRTLHYVGKDQKEEVLEFYAEKVLRSNVNFNITIEPGTLLPELRALREARVIERLSGPLAIMYMDERSGRLDKSKIAADLQFGDSGRESREAQYRKLGSQIVKMLWEGKRVPPALPFYDHTVMMDELEAAMATEEYLHAEPMTQALFAERWEQHRQFLIQEAMAQQQAMQQGAIQSAVAQATQQAAATAAAQTVTESREQVGAQRAQPTDEIVRRANAAEGQRRQ